MKKILTGMDAYLKVTNTEKTENAVFSHKDLITYVRKEINKGGYNIISETYRSTADGNTMQADFKFNYKSDPDFEHVLAVTNFYNKKAETWVTLGACFKDTGSYMMCDAKLFLYDLAENFISDFISSASYNVSLLNVTKNTMRKYDMNTKDLYDFTFNLFVNNFLSSVDMNEMKSKIVKSPYIIPENCVSALTVYKMLGEIIKDTHPKDWYETHRLLEVSLMSYLGVVSNDTSIPETAESVEVETYESPEDSETFVELPF